MKFLSEDISLSLLILVPMLYFGLYWKDICSSRDIAVGIASAYGLDDRGVGFRVPVGSRILSSPRLDRLWGPPNLLSNGYRRLFPPGVKLQVHEADQSPPASAEVKKMWIYTSTPPYSQGQLDLFTLLEYILLIVMCCLNIFRDEVFI
jgi:hypothetical protein